MCASQSPSWPENENVNNYSSLNEGISSLQYAMRFFKRYAMDYIYLIFQVNAQSAIECIAACPSQSSERLNSNETQEVEMYMK